MCCSFISSYIIGIMVPLDAVLYTSVQILKICIILGGCICLYLLMKRKLPPGPIGLPIVGYLPFLDKDRMHLQLAQLGRKYGPIFSIRLGSQLVVIIEDSTVIKELCSKPESNGRPMFPFFSASDLYSPLFQNGKIWSQHRKFLERALVQLGVGKSTSHQFIVKEINSFLEVLTKQDGAPFSTWDQLFSSLFNVMSCILFGKQLESNTNRIVCLGVYKGAIFFQKLSILMFFPWIEKFSFVAKLFLRNFYIQNMVEIYKVSKRVQDILRNEIHNIEKDSDQSDENSFVKMFLMEMKTGENGLDYDFNESALIGMISSLYGAGVLTTMATLEWSFYQMAAMPDIQLKVQQELDEVVGHERSPEYSDLQKMPFTHSVLIEVQRLHTILPLSTSRMILEDVTFRGYTIPKGAILMPNLHAAHHDSKCFPEPEIFIPDRSFDPLTRSTTKPKGYMPFSVGRRRCPGEKFANHTTFLFFTHVLQKFNLQIPEGDSVNFKGEMDITWRLKPHRICFVRRS